MLTLRELRRLALSLPETEERVEGSRPSFQVRGTPIVLLVPRRLRAGLKLTPEEQEALRRAQPAVFKPDRPGRDEGWTWVELRWVDPWIFEELLIGAWRRHASRTAITRWSAEHR
ncbi:MAG TPA: MmcQ/YjbR family DNA-binding protein [Vicinamibacteria bacterium]|nr:MmcQ/YjbR family DNA-binding protein [Vicinamibacteria bacterium]